MPQTYLSTTGGNVKVEDLEGKDVGRDFTIEGQDVSGFYGVSQEYQNYPDDRLKPFRAEGGPDAEIENRVIGEDSDDSDDESPEPKKASSRGRKSHSTQKPPPLP